MYKEITNCLVCSGTLTQVMDLGMQYVVDFVKEKDESLLKAPLTLMKCDGCSLIQLKHRVNPDRLYKKFWYRSGMNPQMKEELLAIVQKASASINLKPGDKVLDIGCNDGTLLGWYDTRPITVGIDPCEDLVLEGVKEKRIDIGIHDYFSAGAVQAQMRSLSMGSDVKFKIITAVAMFYDVEDPVKFLKDCKSLLCQDGVLIIQMNYLYSMLVETAFDNICHEHLTYYSLLSLRRAVEKAGLYIQGAEFSKSNGGSIRAYITYPDFDSFHEQDHEKKLWLATNVEMKIMQEMRAGLDGLNVYKVFENSIKVKMDYLRSFLDDLHGKDIPIYAYGASTRGTTLMQRLFQDECYLAGAAEKDEKKLGLKMVGTWLPIVPEKEARKNSKHMLVLPWHFQESIIDREEDWVIMEKGTLIFPLPTPRMYQFNPDIEGKSLTEKVM